MPENRVDLDPRYVDEYGLPVARITRRYGENEKWIGRVMKDRFKDAFKHFEHVGVLERVTKYKTGLVTLIGHHQHGTCRMGDDPRQSVLDRHCRVHDVDNLFVVDTSCFPTGFGLNPMVTVVANALRVGTWIVNES
jgi:choline dehydrogenase-like flavoprotein